MNESIGVPQIHPSFRERVAAIRAQTFALQTWRPGCARCGERAGELDAEAARAWWADHRNVCQAAHLDAYRAAA